MVEPRALVEILAQMLARGNSYAFIACTEEAKQLLPGVLVVLMLCRGFHFVAEAADSLRCADCEARIRHAVVTDYVRVELDTSGHQHMPSKCTNELWAEHAGPARDFVMDLVVSMKSPQTVFTCPPPTVDRYLEAAAESFEFWARRMRAWLDSAERTEEAGARLESACGALGM